MALDHPDVVERLAVLDIAPTATMYARANREFATRYFWWFFFIQPAPLPERLIEGDPETFLRMHLQAQSRTQGVPGEALVQRSTYAATDGLGRSTRSARTIARRPASDHRRLEGYFDGMRAHGCPFDVADSTLYGPLDRHELAAKLYETDQMRKTNARVQIAELYLWPLVKHGYQEYRPYAACVAKGGVKYSCFEVVQQSLAETTKAQTSV